MSIHEHTSTETPKLSALMRAGAKLHPQAKENYFSVDAQGEVIGTCALGAAYESYYRAKGSACVFPSYLAMTMILNECGIPDSHVVMHPLDKTPNALHDAITDLNDDHSWTREAIADWLETQGL